MLPLLVAGILIAQAPQDPSVPHGPTPPPPPDADKVIETTEPKFAFGDLTPAIPTEIDYDGDGEPDEITVGLSKTGALTVTVALSKTKKPVAVATVATPYQKAGATQWAMHITGDPGAVVVEGWGLKGSQKLAPFKVHADEESVSVEGLGKTTHYKFNGKAFTAL